MSKRLIKCLMYSSQALLLREDSLAGINYLRLIVEIRG